MKQMEYPAFETLGVSAHLEQERHLQHMAYPSVHVDEAGRSATFMLNEMTGRFVGYQTYRPDRDKAAKNEEKGRYHTFQSCFIGLGTRNAGARTAAGGRGRGIRCRSAASTWGLGCGHAGAHAANLVSVVAA